MRPLVLTLLAASLAHGAAMPPATPTPTAPWRVEDLRVGMKGIGKTVMKGTRVETFDAELLGVLRNSSPGRDLVLARLSGLGLEKTGVIAGMSGSPIYVEGRLVGAVAYAWQFGKEPIAGITPFVQMQSFADSLSRREARLTPKRLPLTERLVVGDKAYDAVTVAGGFDDATPKDGFVMTPLRMPLAATGFTPHALSVLGKETARFGMLPVQAGAVSARVAQDEKDVMPEPGGPLSLALISGDFDLSGIGTTTHVEGDRVYGWGHPFMSLGSCKLPMYVGYVHTVYPRLTVSFKMGSPLREVGTIDADVSTCIAGVVGKKADTLPLSSEVTIGKGESRTFNVRLARHDSLLPSLVVTALTNAADTEGEMPEYVTARMRARITLENGRVISIEDTFSGFSGGRAPAVLYNPVAGMVSHLLSNSFKELTVKRIDCVTRIEPGRSSAEIDSVEASATEYAPGDTVRVQVTLKPWRGPRRRVAVEMKLPDDLPPGEYAALVSDEPSSVRQDVRNHPGLLYPTSAEQVLEAMEVLTKANRTTLTMRLPLGTHGVVSSGKAMPTLPGSMVHILAGSKKSGTLPLSRAAVARKDTEWVIQGSETVTFTVTKVRKVTRGEGD
jgi:hypothetical protein